MYVLSIPDRKPHIDDAWLGEHSYWLWHDGVVKSKLMAGIAGSENRLLLHHKLFTLQGAAVISIFGFKLQWLKAISFVYLVLSVILLLQIVRRMKLFNHTTSAAMLVLLLIANPLIFEFSYVFRPELMLMFLGLFSFFFVWSSVKSTSHSKLNGWISGLFAGLTLVTHLNGAVFIAAGFLLLALKRKFAPAMLFSIGAITTAVGYFYDFRSFSDFGLWYEQLTFIPSAEGQSHPIIKLIYNSLGEHFRYFHSPVEISLSLLLLFTGIFGWVKIKEDRSVLIVYTFLLMLSMSALALNKTSKYLILILPYFMMIVTVYFDKLMDSSDRKQLNKFAAVLSIYFLTALVYNTFTIQGKYDPLMNEKIRQTFAQENSKNLHLLAPMEFIFDEIDNFEKITSLMSYNEQIKLFPDLKNVKFFLKAKNEGIDLILLNKEYMKTFDLQSYVINSEIEGFTLVYKDDKLMVWKTIESGHQLTNFTPQKTSYCSGFLQYHSGLN